MEITKLESTILSVARQALVEFNSYTADGLLEEAMIQYGEISTLTMLGKLKDSGFSSEAEKELEQIDREVNRKVQKEPVAKKESEKPKVIITEGGFPRFHVEMEWQAIPRPGDYVNFHNYNDREIVGVVNKVHNKSGILDGRLNFPEITIDVIADIYLDGQSYSAVTSATLYLESHSESGVLTLNVGPGVFGIEKHTIEGSSSYLNSLLHECRISGIPTKSIKL